MLLLLNLNYLISQIGQLRISEAVIKFSFVAPLARVTHNLFCRDHSPRDLGVIAATSASIIVASLGSMYRNQN